MKIQTKNLNTLEVKIYKGNLFLHISEEGGSIHSSIGMGAVLEKEDVEKLRQACESYLGDDAY